MTAQRCETCGRLCEGLRLNLVTKRRECCQCDRTWNEVCRVCHNRRKARRRG